MSELGSYYVTIIPSLKGAAKQITKELGGVDTGSVGSSMGSSLSKSMTAAMDFQSVGKQIQNVGKQISDVGSGLTKAITIPLGGATAAAAGLTATLGWGRLKSLDTAKGQLRGLGYESKDVERITGQLTKDLEGGMMDMGQATSAAATAMAAGVDEGAELTRYIKTLDAAAVGSSGPLDEMSQIFGRITDQGKLTRTEFDIISNRMPGFSSAVQDAMGVSSEAMYEMLRNGEITSEDFLDIMEDFAGGMAAEHSNTWEGMVQNTKAYVGMIGENMLGGVFEQSKESLAEFIDFLSSEEVLAWAAGVGESLGNAFARIIEAVKAAIEWWMSLDGSTQKAILTMAGVAVAAGPLLVIFGKITGVIGSVVAAVGRFLASPIGKFIGGVVARSGLLNSALVLLGNVFLRIIGPIGLAVTALMALWEHSEVFRDGIMHLGEVVWEALKSIGAEFQRLWEEAIQPILEILKPAAEEAFGFFKTWVLPVMEAVFTGIFWVVEEVIGNVVGIISGLVDVITGIVGFIKAIFTGDWAQAWEMLKQIVSGAVKAVWNFIQLWVVGKVMKLFKGFGSTLNKFWQGLWSGIQKLVTSVWQAISKFFSTIFGSIRSLFTTVWNSIRGVVTTAINGVRNTITSVINSVRNTWNNVWSGIGSFFSNIWSSIVSAARGFTTSVRNSFSNVIDFVKSIPSRILNMFSNAGSWLLNSGKNMIAGFTNGITNAFGNAVDAVKRGVEKVRRFLPFSPAKEGPFSGKGYTTYSGQALIRDFGEGIADASPEAIRDMSQAAEQIAAETDLSASIPDFLPEEWTAPMVPDDIASIRPTAGNTESELVGAGVGAGDTYNFNGLRADDAHGLMQEAKFAKMARRPRGGK